MKNRPMARRIRYFLAMCAIAFCVANPLTALPSQDERERKLWDMNLIDSKSKQPGKRRAPKRRYEKKTPNTPTIGVAGDTVIGVTIWRLRKSRATDRARLLAHEGQFTPERIEADTLLSEGDRVRLSIEAARKGYLYVIDREEYADGTSSDPFLIFPTAHLRGGRNDVQVGRIIDIPAQEDKPNYFTLKRTGSKSDLTGELITLIVTPTPIQNLGIGNYPIRLPRELVDEWEKRWGGQTGRLELQDGKGAAWTPAEKEAGASGTRLLTHKEPNPQTIYYNPDKRSGEPMLVKLRLSLVKK